MVNRNSRAGFAPEHRFIMDCIRCVFGQRRRPEAEPDWAVVLETAFRHGVAPLVHAGLKLSGQSAPEAVRAQLMVGYAANATRARIHVAPTLRSALEALGGAGLEPIVLKGAGLAYLVYPQPGHRTLADIDLLLPEGQLGPARDALLGLGFRAAEDQPWPHGHRHLPALIAPGGQLTLELHRHIVDEDGAYILEVEQLRTRSELRSLAGLQARVLAPTDTLLHVCVHLAHDHRYRWFPLRSLTDILAITSCRSQDLDWDLFVDTVHRSRMSGAVYWPLYLSHTWLGAPIPRPVLSALAPGAAARRLIEAAADWRRILDPEESSEPAGRAVFNILLDLSLCGGCSASEQVRVVLRGLFPVPRHLPADVTRSPTQYWAYLLRPARLARGIVAFGRSVAHQPGPD